MQLNYNTFYETLLAFATAHPLIQGRLDYSGNGSIGSSSFTQYPRIFLENQSSVSLTPPGVRAGTTNARYMVSILDRPAGTATSQSAGDAPRVLASLNKTYSIATELLRWLQKQSHLFTLTQEVQVTELINSTSSALYGQLVELTLTSTDKWNSCADPVQGRYEPGKAAPAYVPADCPPCPEPDTVQNMKFVFTADTASSYTINLGSDADTPTTLNVFSPFDGTFNLLVNGAVIQGPYVGKKNDVLQVVRISGNPTVLVGYNSGI